MPNYKKNGSLSSRELAQVKKVVKAENRQSAERHSRIYEISGQEVSNTGFTIINTFQDLTVLSQGHQVWERVGNRVTPTYLQIRYQLAQAIAGRTNTVRLVLFKLQRDSTVPPTVAEIFSPPSLPVDNVYALYQRTLKDIQIVKDWTVTLSNQYKQQRVGMLKLNLTKIYKSQGCQYNDASTNGLDHLFLYVVSDTTIANHPTFTAQMKLSYRDE